MDPKIKVKNATRTGKRWRQELRRDMRFAGLNLLDKLHAVDKEAEGVADVIP